MKAKTSQSFHTVCFFREIWQHCDCQTGICSHLMLKEKENKHSAWYLLWRGSKRVETMADWCRPWSATSNVAYCLRLPCFMSSQTLLCVSSVFHLAAFGLLWFFYCSVCGKMLQTEHQVHHRLHW